MEGPRIGQLDGAGSQGRLAWEEGWLEDAALKRILFSRTRSRRRDEYTCFYWYTMKRNWCLELGFLLVWAMRISIGVEDMRSRTEILEYARHSDVQWTMNRQRMPHGVNIDSSVKATVWHPVPHRSSSNENPTLATTFLSEKVVSPIPRNHRIYHAVKEDISPTTQNAMHAP